MADSANDARSLLELAIDAHTTLGKLATGLAHAGADPQAVSGLQRIVVMVADIAKALGTGPVGGAPGQPGAGPAPGAPPPAGPEAAAGPPAAPQAPAAAPVGPPQGVRPGERPNGLHEATANLQAALASKHAAAQRQLAGQ